MRQPFGAEYSIERLRTSGMVFVAGRAISAGLNIYIFYLVATRLPIPTFALYVWLLALGRLLRQFSDLGLSAVGLRYVPVLHTQFGGQVWQRFVLALVAARVATIVLSIGATVAFAHGIVALFGEPSWLEPLYWFALVMLIEHTLEFLRQFVFAPLMRQLALQLNLVAQAVVILVALELGLAMHAGDPTIYWVIGAQACGSGVALAIAAALFWHLARGRSEPRGSESPPTWREMIRFGLENFSHSLLYLAAGAQIMTLLGSRLLGVTELATFGFIQNLYVRIERLVPGRFFFGLIQPSVIVRYEADSSFAGLNRRIVLILKLSFAVWAALATFLVITGEPILGLLSSEKYRDGYGLLLGFIAILAIQDLKRVVVLVTNTLRRSELLRRAGFIYLVAVPTAIAMSATGAGFYGLMLGMVVAEVGFIVGVVVQLRQAGFRLAFDLHAQARILAAAVVATVAGVVVAQALPDGFGSVLLGVALALPTFGLVLWRLRPLRADERRTLERLLNQRLSWL